MLGSHGGDAGVGQPDSVDHPTAELGDARRRRARARLRADRLRHDPPQRGEIHDTVELVPVRRRTGGEDDGILEGETGRLNPERGSVDAHCRATPPGEPTPVPAATRRSYRLRYSSTPSATADDSSSIRFGSVMYEASLAFVPNPISTSTAGMNAVTSTRNPACFTPRF